MRVKVNIPRSEVHALLNIVGRYNSTQWGEHPPLWLYFCCFSLDARDGRAVGECHIDIRPTFSEKEMTGRKIICGVGDFNRIIHPDDITQVADD